MHKKLVITVMILAALGIALAVVMRMRAGAVTEGQGGAQCVPPPGQTVCVTTSSSGGDKITG